MAQTIIVQDGIILYKTSDPSYSVDMTVNGNLNLTNHLVLGTFDNDGVIRTPEGSSVGLSLRSSTDGVTAGDISIEPANDGRLFLGNEQWPDGTIGAQPGMYVGASDYDTLQYYNFVIGNEVSDTLTVAELNDLYPNAQAGQSVSGPTVLYYCIAAGDWRILSSSGGGGGGAAVPQVFTFTYEDIFTLGSPTSPVTADVLYVVPETYVELDMTSLLFFDPGTYSVNIQGQLLDQANDNLWYTFNTSYGPKLNTSASMSVVNLQNYSEHFTTTDIRDRPFDVNGPSFNDTFIVQTGADQLLDIQLWVYSFYAEGEQASGKTVVTVTRLSDDAGPWA